MTIKQLSDILRTFDYVVTKLNLYHGQHCYLIYNDKDVDINAVILPYMNNRIQWNVDPGQMPAPVWNAINTYAKHSSKAWSLGYHAGWENTKHAYQKGYKKAMLSIQDTIRHKYNCYENHGASRIHTLGKDKPYDDLGVNELYP